MRLIPLVLAVVPLLVCHQAAAGQKTVTYYLDGARIEQELGSSGGYLEVPLPESFVPGSLRVKAPGGTVLRVEQVSASEDRRRSQELSRLKERRAELQDRMAALVRREEIFSAAAKSQSGKSPRKTKANPDPLGTLQQGTDFAIAQMEAVYRSKRKCQKALDEVERELTAAVKGVALARIWIAGGKARVNYLVGNERWIPRYDLRFGESESELLLHAKLPPGEKGTLCRVSRGTAAQAGASEPVRGEFPAMGRYPLSRVSGPGEGASHTRFRFAAVEPGLPSGEAALFWEGEYLGSGPFPGGGATEFGIGK